VTRKPDRRLLVTILALVLLAVALLTILRPTSAPYLDLLRQGDEHAARAERTAAVAAYREAARLRPGDPDPYLRLAQVYLDWGRTDDALTAAARAERLGVGKAGGSAALAASLERLWVAAHAARADWPAVVEHAQRLLALAPADGSTNSVKARSDAGATRHILARAYVELGEWDAARAEYEALLRADPADAVARERLGALLLGDDPVAIQHLFAAGTDLADRLLAAMGEPGTAGDPAYASALLGRVFFEGQEWALAVRQFERALSYSPDYPDAHAYLGHALDQMERPDEARPHLLRAVALAPDSAVARTFLGLHYDRMGDFSAARAEYEMAYDLDPDNPATCVEIGQTWVAERRYVAAEIWLREAISLQPDDPALWEILTRFYLDHTITVEGRGVEAAEKLVELSPDDARAQDLRGWAAFQIGDYGTARDSLLQAISIDPALAPAHYHLGLLWAAQGAHQEAQDAFVRALDLDTTGELVPLVEREMGSAKEGARRGMGMRGANCFEAGA
jgi:tetratricopeptide (TPR) repeat protein